MSDSVSNLERLFARGGKKFIVHFFDQLPMDAVLNVSKTGIFLRQSVALYFCIRMSADKSLSYWFLSPTDFRCRLLKCDGIVAGIFPLYLMTRDRTPNPKLDIIVPWSGVLEMGKYLKDQGYQYVSPIRDQLSFENVVLSAGISDRMGRFGKPESSLRNPLVKDFTFALMDDNEDDGDAPWYMPKHINIMAVRGSPLRYLLDGHASERIYPSRFRLCFLEEFLTT